MKTFYLILYIVALVLFVIAVFAPAPAAGPRMRLNLVAAGLAAWVLVDVCRQWDLVVN